VEIPPYLRALVGKHAVFYRVTTGGEVLIVRVLHATMLPELHLRDVDDTELPLARPLVTPATVTDPPPEFSDHKTQNAESALANSAFSFFVARGRYPAWTTDFWLSFEARVA